MNAISPFLSVGVYHVSLAARLAEVPPARARAWVRGYRRPGQDGSPGTRGRPLLGSRLAGATEDPLVTFADLVEMRFTRHFRQAGFSWKRILANLPELRRVVLQQKGEGALTVESDGVKILAHIVAQDGQKRAVELDNRQLVLV